jgi:hypothetical protein
MRLGVLLLVGLLCGGCFWRLDKMTEALNERHVQSCIWSAGFPWPFEYLRIITVTGGMTMAECADLERMLGP